MAAILSRPQCVKAFFGSPTYCRHGRFRPFWSARRPPGVVCVVCAERRVFVRELLGCLADVQRCEQSQAASFVLNTGFVVEMFQMVTKPRPHSVVPDLEMSNRKLVHLTCCQIIRNNVRSRYFAVSFSPNNAENKAKARTQDVFTDFIVWTKF